MTRWFRRLAPMLAAAFLTVGFAETAAAQYCVRYVRSLTDFEVRGDAWAWWPNAEGLYPRGHTPIEGSVMVFSRSRGMPLGHVSTVTAIVDSRTVLVDHSFGGPVLWRDMPIIDTSANNDWSQVRVWHGPTNQLGSTDFPISGFIYPADYTPPAQSVAASAVTPTERAIQMVRSVTAPTPAPAAIDGAALAASMPTPDRRPAVPGPVVLAAAETLPTSTETVHIPREPVGASATSNDLRLTAAAVVSGSDWIPPDLADAPFTTYVPRRPPLGRVATPQAADAAGTTVTVRR